MTETLQGTPRAYSIPVANLPRLQEKIDKLNRKASRLGVAPVALHTVSSFEVPGGFKVEDGIKIEQPPRVYRNVVVTGGNPVLPGGWRFVATLQHTTEGNVIRKAPTAEEVDLPSEFRTCEPWCHHCKTSRRRIDTFVVRSEAGELKQIGRNCITAFLGGVTGEDYAGRFEFETSLAGALESEGEWGGYGGRGEDLFTLQRLLSVVVACVRAGGGGFISGKLSRERDTSSTKDDALTVLFPPSMNGMNSRARQRLIQWLSDRQPSEQDAAEAKSVIEFASAEIAKRAEGDKELSDFEHNLKIVLALEYLTRRDAGLGAYVFEFVRREKSRNIEREGRPASVHVGKVGERLRGISLTVERIIGLPDYGFGPSSINIFRDASGNCLTWKTGVSDLTVGDVVTLDGTVKEHNDYKGRLQTVLSRCKIKACAAASV